MSASAPPAPAAAASPTASAAALARAAALGAKLRALRAQLRRVAAMYGVVRVLLLLLGLLVASFALDRLLELPLGFRAVLVALAVVALAAASWSWLVQPVLRASRLDDDEAALLVERHFALRDELISAVQLARALGRGGEGQQGPDGVAALAPSWSPVLVGQVVAAAADHTSRLDFREAIERSGLRRSGIALLLAFALLGGAAAWRPAESWIWLQRMVLLRPVPWPRAVELEVAMEPPSGVVARGDDLVVTARALRGNPVQVELVPQLRAGGATEALPMVETRGVWRVVLSNLNEPLSFYVRGGDYTSPRFEVQVRPRPQLEELRVWVEYPEYTGLADTPPERPLPDGNLKVPVGSVVRYEARASRPLVAAAVRFGNEAAVAVRAPASLARDAGGAPRLLAGSFAVLDSTSWAFDLTSTDGFRSELAAQYALRVIPDRLPEVRLTEPARNKEVTPGAVVPLAAQLRDDYGLRAAALVYARLGAGARSGPAGAGEEAAERGAEPAEAAGIERRVPLALEATEAGADSPVPAEAAAAPPVQAVVAHRFELEPLGLRPGERVLYWIEAVDTRASAPDTTSVEPAQRGSSQRYQLQVVSPVDLERVLQGRIKRVRDELVQLARAQGASRAELLALAQGLAGASAPSAEQRRQLTYAELDQRRVEQRLGRAASEIGEIADEMAYNRVGAEGEDAWLRGIEAELTELGRGPAAEASRLLQAERQRERPEAAGLSQAAALAERVVARLEDIVRRLEKWDEYNEVLRELRDLIQMQDRIMEQTRQRARADLGR
ncbi:MAG: polyketide synthase [Planctomycetota bacterium]|nr:MAG: polyketide synthase [Planctomycetota bacterium]